MREALLGGGRGAAFVKTGTLILERMRKKLTTIELDHENGSRLRRQVAESEDKAIKVALEKTRDTIGILVDAEEYALLRAVYDLVTSPDGPSKLAGTYDYRKSNTIPYENALARRE